MADFNINKRLKYLIEEHYKVSPVEFAKKYKDQKAVKTYNILSERNGLSNKMLETITGAYPEISRSWLLTGEGEMLKNGYKALTPGNSIVSEPTDSLSELTTEQRLEIAEKRIVEIEMQLSELTENNKWYRQTIDKLLSTREKKTASSAPAADAGCAAVG